MDRQEQSDGCRTTFPAASTSQQEQVLAFPRAEYINCSVNLSRTPARRGAKSDLFDDLLRWGGTVRADQFALAQREIDHADLKDQIGVADMDLVIDAMLAGHKVIWH